ncbi:MAG: branched-chain amino acid ABC transporter permease [Candidatus Woesearchaeota archaeon]
MSAYLTHILIIIAIYAILAASYNLLLGNGGMLNLALVALFGIGAYTSAIFMMQLHLPYLVALLAAAIITASFAVALLYSTKHVKGDYLALATLGFSYVIGNILLNWTSVTRGALGIPGIPKPELLGVSITTNNHYLLFAAILATISVYTIHAVATSRFGRALQAARDDEAGAQMLGKNVLSIQAKTNAISGFFIGVAGSLYAHYISYIDPTSFMLLELVLLLTVVIVGGLASTKGSIAGVILIIGLGEALRFIGLPSSILGPARQIIYASILILILMNKPKGLFGKVSLQ